METSQRTRTATDPCTNEETEFCVQSNCPGECVEPELIWGNWSPCSLSCNPADAGITPERTRTPVTASGDANELCTNSETESCNLDACPTLCVGDDLVWSEWSACNLSCQSLAGYSERTRSPNDPNCTNDSETESCDMPPCPFWNWSTWGTCGGTCNSQTRQRTAADCSTSLTTPCESEVGPGSEDESCIVAASCAEFTWGEWGACSAPLCGGGTQVRIATGCNTGNPSDCGAIGLARVQDSCNPLPCFSCDDPVFTDCSATCGGGTLSMTTCSTCLLPFGTFDEVGIDLCNYLIGVEEPCNTFRAMSPISINLNFKQF